MFLNLPTLLTWARIVAIPLIVGVFYLPLDAAHPRERLRFAIADSGATVLLADAAQADALGAQCRSLQAADPDWAASLQLLGPIEAPLTRIAGHYRWQILVKSLHAAALHRFMDRLLAVYPQGASRSRVKLVIDVEKAVVAIGGELHADADHPVAAGHPEGEYLKGWMLHAD